MSAMLLLTFNCMQKPQHSQMLSDNQLVNRGLQMLDRVAEETQSEIVRAFRKTCTELLLDAQRRHAEVSATADNLDLSAYIVTS
jgi:hypothetical protein